MSEEQSEINNSLTELVTSLYNRGGLTGQFSGVQLSQSDTMFINLRWYLISNYRQLLSQLYTEIGIVQTLVDQPVDDAYRTGFEIHTNMLDPEEIEELEVFMEREEVIHNLMQAIKWARLYGGGAILLITNENPETPFDVTKLEKGAPVEFRPVDLWELYHTEANIEGDTSVGGMDWDQEYYDYYGKRVHSSRVYKIKGKAPPSFVRPRLRGWGMSELERVVRSINKYFKHQDVVFELLDEAKVDVYKMKGFNSALLTSGGTAKVSERIQHANTIKNFQSALTMDAEDEYEQKQMSFAGLSEMLKDIRQGLAADLKMPMTKLFGVSSSGFNSGEDDIENYNTMLESEIRAKTKFMCVDMINICCALKFGFVPDDLKIHFLPLRILNAPEEEEVKNHKYNRLMSSYQSGVIDRKTWAEGVNKDNLLPIEVDENAEALEPLEFGENFVVTSGDNVDGSK